MQDGPEFRHLIAFIAVTEECNFSKASERIHITQPALSAQIKQLEGWLGARLFHRVPRGAELTEQGRNFLPYARRLLHMRQHALTAASRRHSSLDCPLRLGYSPFVNHDLIREAFVGYQETVPEGQINSSSDCTAKLLEMLLDGRLDAAIVTSPILANGLVEQRICEDRLLVCLRRDHALASTAKIPKDAVADKMRVFFNRDYHPALHDQLLRRLKRAGIHIRPTETYSAPHEMQFLVKTKGHFSLVREHEVLDPELTVRPIEGLELRANTIFVCHCDQQQPVFPVLAYRMAQRALQLGSSIKRKPSQSVHPLQQPLIFGKDTGSSSDRDLHRSA